LAPGRQPPNAETVPIPGRSALRERTHLIYIMEPTGANANDDASVRVVVASRQRGRVVR